MDATRQFRELKKRLSGVWRGEGFAKFPTIEDTGYVEETVFRPDESKDAIFYSQKTWYRNDSKKNGQTVFWDTGFIFLKDKNILLHSVQIGGRQEQYQLVQQEGDLFGFDSVAIMADPKTIRSQRLFTIGSEKLTYEINMATHQAQEFQNHLKAELKKVPAER